MSGLQLRFLGDFEVWRGGKSLPLPPSRKTRALLAYLSLQSRRFRREYLCELLWEVPDDPRGSLRWSLTKLRRLVDDQKRTRIVADRATVSIDAADISIDVLDLRQLAARNLAEVPLEKLEAAAASYRGNFLEGLEFSNFHDYHSWCVAEREQALRDRASILTELAQRLGGEPARALPHIRVLVGLSPYDENHRANLIRLLHAAQQPSEAEEQYQLGLRMLKEAGVNSSGALLAALRAPRNPVPAPVPSTPPEVRLPDERRDRRIMVGRDAEIALITKTFENGVKTRHGGLMLLRGAPGIGKTRLMNHLLELSRERNDLVIRASAFEADAIRPFALWIDALRSLGGGHYETIFGASGDSNRERLFAGLSDFAAREAAARPLVLLFDDVHWCDESSAAALHYMLRMNRDRTLFAIVTARDSELRDNTHMQLALRGMRRDRMVTEVDLQPLPVADTATLIAAIVPKADAKTLSMKSGGNPLLAIELARAEERGLMGSSLGDLVRDWLERFGAVGGEVLRWAAVLTPRIDVPTLTRFAGIDAATVGEALEEARRHAMLLDTEQGLAFAHDSIAQAVYADISPLRRQVMHRRVAEMLEGASSPELTNAAELAHHATQSGDNALAARAMVSAGRLCLRFFANDEAQVLARKGLQLAEAMSDAERVCVEIDLHDVLLAAGPLDDWEKTANRYAALAEQALDHGALAHARLGYHMVASVRWAKGDWNAAREQALQALRVVRGGQGETQIIGMAESAKCLALLERDLGRADAMLMEAHALASRNQVAHYAIAAGIGMLRLHQGRFDEAEEQFQEARTLCKASGDRLNEYQANEYLAMLYLQQGRLAEAESRCHELVTLGEKLREGSEEPFARAILGLCVYARDDDPMLLDESLPDVRAADAKHRLAYLLTRAAAIDCERDRGESALARAKEALVYAELLERATETRIANAVLAHCYAASDEPKKAAGFAAAARRSQDEGAAAWSVAVVDGLLPSATTRSKRSRRSL